MTSEGLHTPKASTRIVGLQACTPLGLDAETTYAEIAAGTLRIAETEILQGREEAVRAVRLPLIASSASRTERISALATMGLRAHLDLVRGLIDLKRVRSLPLLLALPEDEGVDFRHIQRTLAATALEAAPGVLVELPTAPTAEGRAGFFAVLAQALSWIDAGRGRAVIVGGADSLCDPESLARLARTNRLLGGNNSDGMIPGEGAGFGMIVGPDVPLAEDARPLELLGVSIARERQHSMQAEPNVSEALTSAFRHLRTHTRAGGRHVDHLLSCQTGELFWAEEFTRAYLRNGLLLPEPLTVNLVAQGLGDVGAAAGIVQLAMAPLHMQRLLAGEDPSKLPTAAPRILLYGCSDTGLVGACVVEGQTPVRAKTAERSASAPTLRPVAEASAQTAKHGEFGATFHEEHLEEIGFLLDHRRTYLDAQWQAAAKLEKRITRHVEALIAWGDDGPIPILHAALAGELGEDALRGGVFSAASLGDRLGERAGLLDAFAATDATHLSSWIQGLSLALSVGIANHLAAFLASERPEIQVAAASVMGRRREGEPTALLSLLGPGTTAPLAVQASAAIALAKMGFSGAEVAVERAYRANPQSSDLFYAALCLTGPKVLDVARAVIRGAAGVDPRMYVLLALGGSVEDANLLLRADPETTPQKAALSTALGVLGVPEAIFPLLRQLESDDPLVVCATAEALERITAAGLRGTFWLSDDGAVHSSPPTGDEKSDTGNGRWVERPTPDPAAWGAWWRTNSRHFTKSTRFRCGRPFDLRACLTEASLPYAPHSLRALAVDELRIRSRRCLPFEIDDFIPRQMAGLAACDSWCESAPDPTPRRH